MQRLIVPLRKSLVLRMSLAVCTFLLLFLLVILAIVYSYFESEFKKNISDQQATLLSAVAESIDYKLDSYLRVISDVSKTVTPQVLKDSKAAKAFLDSRTGTKSIFNARLDLMTADGKIIACSSCQPGDMGQDLSRAPSIRKLIESGKPLVSEPFVTAAQKDVPIIGFLAPVHDKNGRLIGILGGSINLLEKGLLEDLQQIRIARTGYLYIYAKDRTYIMHPDRPRILTRILPPGVNRYFDAAIEGFEGTGRVVNSFGVDNLSTFKHLKSVNWILASNYPVAEAYEPLERIKKYFFLVALAGSLLMIVVVRAMMKRYSSTLVRFAEHVGMVADEGPEKKIFQHDSQDEIGVLVNTFNRMVELEEQRKQELLYTGNHDGLTGLYNRGYFDSELRRVSRGRLAPISIVVADLDGLKKCNDTLGHAVGDDMIRAAARALSEAFRAEDVVARIGGDEFAVIVPGLGKEAVEKAVERLSVLVDASDFRGNGFSLAMSLGWATAESPDDIVDAFKAADKNMYHDKMLRKRARNEKNWH